MYYSLHNHFLRLCIQEKEVAVAMSGTLHNFPPANSALNEFEAGEKLSRADQLEYLADLTLELKEIADNLGCATLASVLVVAYREAVIQAQRR